MTNLDHLVVGLDDSNDSARALRWAAAQTPQLITAVHAFSPGLELLAASVQINLDPVRAEHQNLLDTRWSAPARALGVPVDTVLIDDDPATALAHVAQTRSADAIVIGHQGHHRWNAHHVGETAGRLLHHCDTPLIVTNDTTEPQPLAGSIVVGLSRPANPDNPELQWAINVAEHHKAQLHVVCLVEPMAYVDANYSRDMADIHHEMREQLDALAATLRHQHRTIGISTEVRDGPTLHELAAVTHETDAGLVVIGSHHPGLISGFIAGSVARLLPPLIRCPTAAVPHR